MKKILLILSFLFCFVLAGCKTNKTPDAGNEENGNKTEVVTEGVTQPGVTEEQPTVPGVTVEQPTQPEENQKPTGPLGPGYPIYQPTLSVGFCDVGYTNTKNPLEELDDSHLFTIIKSASAGTWTSASIDVTDYNSDYSKFTMKFRTAGVKHLVIELLIAGGQSDWSNSVEIYNEQINKEFYEIEVDFTNLNVISTTTWDYVQGHYVKDYLVGFRFFMDTATDNKSDLVNQDAICDVSSIIFKKGTVNNPTDDIPTVDVPTGDKPTENPSTPEVDLNAPTFGLGWCDDGYKGTKQNGENSFTINKDANAIQWGGATIQVVDYTSPYSAFTLKVNTTNVTNLCIQLFVTGGESTWSNYVSVYQDNITDGEHTIEIDFTDVNPVDTSTWASVSGYYIKDYTIEGIVISLDTAVDDGALKNVAEVCEIESIQFVKVGESDEPTQGGDVDQPTQGGDINEPTENPVDPTPGPTIPVDPNAPKLYVGWNDTGYTNALNSETGEFTINKAANAIQWGAATLGIDGYDSKYSSFVIRLTTTNVTNLSIQLYVEGLQSGWTNYLTLYSGTVKNGTHRFEIDFTDMRPIDGNTWQSVPGYYIKDFDVKSIKIALDTAVDESQLVNEAAKCVIHELSFVKVELENTPEAPYEPNEEYVPSNSTLTFSDKNANKVITEATFDVTQYTLNAGAKIQPYGMFSNGMCLQRDAVNRIWGKASDTNYIAIMLKGNIYYGTVTNGEWEVYLPKLNAGGPYNMTIISEAGRIVIVNVYIGEVYYCGGQSNMEWQPQHSGDVLASLYSSSACVNDNIRMLYVGYNPEEAPTTEVSGTWVWRGANQTTIPTFSAVAYLFAKQMQEELGCPVGVIAAPIGGSSIEFWLSEANVNVIKDIYTPYESGDIFMTPTYGYNGMLYPLTGINVRGVVWYQGCSNAFGTQGYYDIALKLFMNQCREMFDNDKLSFTVCELARYEMDPLAYSTINEKINKVADEDQYVIVARNLDLGEWNDIHPKDKREIAKRAAYETLRVFYGLDKDAPIDFTSYTFNNDGTVTITLSAEATLVNGTNGFEVYVNGAYTYNCNVSINGNTLTVSASGEITKVRYGYTCQMTNEIKNDVSKMVTVYDGNGFPLDLFLIEK